MRHNYLKDDPNSCSHWAAKNNELGNVFVQLGNEEGHHIKLELTTEQAETMATHLFNMAHASRNAQRVTTSSKKHAQFLNEEHQTTQNDFTKAWEQRLADPENSILLAEEESITPEKVNERLNNLINDLSEAFPKDNLDNETH